MSIIDPHIHLWDLRGTPREQSLAVKLLGWNPRLMNWLATRLFPRATVDFFGAPKHLLVDYLPENYRADTAGRHVTGFIHVEAGWHEPGPLGPVGETRWLEQIDPRDLLGIVGYADLMLGDAVEEVLGAHLEASPRFRGIRYRLAHHPRKHVMDSSEQARIMHHEQFRRGYSQLGKHGLTFDAWVYHHQLEDISALARDFPEIPVVLCHAGTPVGYGGPFGGCGVSETERERITATWKESLARVAENQNTSIKLSGLTMPALGWAFHQRAEGPGADELAEALGPIIDFVIDTFGVDRCMFASNFPIDKVSVSWDTLYTAYEQAVADRGEEDRAALFGGTAAAVYGLNRADD